MRVFGKSVGYLCVMGLFVVTLFTGCGKKVSTTEEVTTEKEITETVTITEEATEDLTTTTSNDFEGGLKEDGKGILQEEDLLGEWLYVQHGCILTFKEDGICNVMYEGKDYACTYKCEDDQLILIYNEKETIGVIHDDDSMLYFNDSKFGFMTSYMWENSGVEATVSENESLTQLRKTIEESDAIAGIFYVGYYEGRPYDADFVADEEAKRYFDKYPFLSDILPESYARNDGSEIYCIVPADVNAIVEVAQWDAMTETVGEVLYHSESGNPFWIQGNISDVMPNLVVTIEDGKGNKLEQYQPFISLKDGTVALPEDSQPKFVDFTIYEGIK